MGAQTVILAIAALGVLIIVATVLRRYVPFLRRLYIPSPITAGVIGLLLGPQVLGEFAEDSRWRDGLFGADIGAVWQELPGLLINVVFASILLGKALPSPRVIWDRSASQALFGAALSFGQYAVGCLIALTVLVPVFDLSELSGALLEISFTGGHGTAAGLDATMSERGFEEGASLALGLATIGLVAGLVFGTLLINRAIRSTTMRIAREDEVEFEADYEVTRLDNSEVPERDEPDAATSPLTLALGIISLAIGIGWALQRLLAHLEGQLADTPIAETFLLEIPLFPFTIIGGAVVQIVASIRGWTHLVSRATVNQVSGLALDLLIAAAIATLSISTLADNVGPLVLMAGAAFGWVLFSFLVIAPRLYGEGWFERAIGDFGQSSGTVASGFMLIDMSDPGQATGSREAYGYKQLLFEPFLGGGIVTALAVPFIDGAGLVTSTVVATVATLLAVGVGLWRRRGRPHPAT